MTELENWVCVKAVPDGWSVRSNALDEPQFFCSGAKAEALAHDLGRRLAESGSTTSVTIHDRADVALVTARYFGVEEGPLHSPASRARARAEGRDFATTDRVMT